MKNYNQKNIKKLFSFCFAVALMTNCVFAQSKKAIKGPLDKKSYTCEITENGKKKATPIKDEIKFAADKFQCKMLLDEGYKATAYTATIDSSESPMVITFTAEAQGEKDMVFKWEGTITDDVIEGTAEILKKDKQKKSFTYSGTLKGKKPKKE